MKEAPPSLKKKPTTSTGEGGKGGILITQPSELRACSKKMECFTKSNRNEDTYSNEEHKEQFLIKKL